MKSRTAIVVIAAVLAACAAGVSLSSCGDDSLSRMEQSGTLRIGYAVEAPYAFVTAEGDITGVDAEVAKHVAATLGFAHVEWVLTEFGSLIAGLQSGRFDVIAAGMFITKERAGQVSFSEPTFRVQQGLLVPQGNPKGLHSYEAVAGDATAKVAVISGAVEERLLLATGVPDERLVRVPDALAGIKAVESSVADALALSSPTFRWMQVNGTLGATTIAEPFTQPAWAAQQLLGYGGFAFRKEDTRLREAWNEVLAGFVGSADHLSLLARFGMCDEELPGAVTTSQIVAAE